MNRYTLKVQCLDNSVNAVNLRSTVDDFFQWYVLIHQVGRIKSTESGGFLAEFATSAKKHFLEPHLKELESKLPIRVENIYWGWLAGGTPHPEAAMTPVTFKFEKIWNWAFSTFVLIVTALLIAIPFLWNGPIPRFLRLFIEIATYTALYLLTFYFSPIFFLHLKQVDCLPEELVLTYHIRKNAVHIHWEEIWGLDIFGRQCNLHTNPKKIRFYFPLRVKTNDMIGLIETIARQANLNDVDDRTNKVLYKRYDAP